VIGEVLMVLRPDGDVLCRECRVASKFSTRFRGLLGRGKLPATRGVLLSRTNFIHTHFMRFPIDVVFLDGAMEIVKVVEDLKPWRMARCPNASAVLELAAGSCHYSGVRVGERLSLVSGKVEENAGGAIRVALSTRDRRFDRVASFLLARNGFVVTRGRGGEALTELVRNGAVDVILLDASDSLVGAARTARSLEVMAPDVGLVLMVSGDEPNGEGAHPVSGLRVDRVPKWGPFEAVVAAVEHSYSSRVGEPA
jgi:uncharacterized protein